MSEWFAMLKMGALIIGAAICFAGLVAVIVTLATGHLPPSPAEERARSWDINYWQERAPAGWCVFEMHREEPSGYGTPIYRKCEEK